MNGKRQFVLFWTTYLVGTLIGYIYIGQILINKVKGQ